MVHGDAGIREVPNIAKRALYPGTEAVLRHFTLNDQTQVRVSIHQNFEYRCGLRQMPKAMIGNAAIERKRFQWFQPGIAHQSCVLIHAEGVLCPEDKADTNIIILDPGVYPCPFQSNTKLMPKVSL